MTTAAMFRTMRAHARRTLASRRIQDGMKALVLGPMLGFMLNASATTALSDGPIFATNSVPGNVALALSVEWPTAVRTAHTATTYSLAARYLGYFDPDKCYLYRYVAAETSTDLSYFYPVGLNATHNCTGANQWSGNYLNWAATPAIDPFRWVMTGGYRVIDTTSLTVLQKARHSGQGGLTPDTNLTTAAQVAAATPFSFSTLTSRVQSTGIKMRFATDANALSGYFNNVSLSGAPALTRSGETVDYSWTGSPGLNVNSDNFSVRWTARHTALTSGTYTFQTMSKNGVRLYIDNVAIINNWTDHALTTNAGTVSLTAGQQYNIRLEYYDKGGISEIRLRWQPPAATAFTAYPHAMGPIPYDPATALIAGVEYEVNMRTRVCDASVAAGGVEANCKRYGSNWKPEGLMQQYANRLRFSAFGYINETGNQRDGGVMRARQKFVGPTQPVPGQPAVDNTAKEWDPGTGIFLTNPDEADATQTNATYAPSVAVANSGVANYLNKFGQLLPGNYKGNDPVGEMYYAALRYYRNLGSIPEWNAINTTDPAVVTGRLDGFPVVTNWDDPVQYSCQKNFILGIGDIYTHADKNLPGSTGTTFEPAKPAAVTSDTVNAEAATNLAFALQGLTVPNADNYSGRNNSAGMVGLAYHANVNDIRPDVAGQKHTIGKQNVQTLWVDVLEQPFVSDNQFYLTAKFGGFIPPKDLDPPYSYSNTTPLPQAYWSNSGELVGTQARPDNYFTAGNPDQMISGLTQAFDRINSLNSAFTTSFSTSQPQVSDSNNPSFGTTYDPSNWTGEVIANQLSFNSAGDPAQVESWRATAKLATQLATTGWDTNRRVVTWNGSAGVAFRSTTITAGQLATLDTAYRFGDDSADYLNYLRGDRTHEQASTVSGSSKAYRTRAKLLGDIVGSKARAVGPPALPLSEASNPGYSAFKIAQASRPTVLYVGANDGMLHAFNGALNGTEAGKEIFAFVPSATFNGPTGSPGVNGLASLGRPAFSHHSFVNATPKDFDVDLDKTWNGVSVGVSATPTPDWHSILIGGLGKGGRSYYAIDVTNPATITSETIAAGRVLWEFTAPEMGYTFGEPIVVKTRKYGWTVILPSGYNTPDGKGYLFFVNPRTGELLEKVGTGEGSTTSDAGFAHANAYLVDYSDGYADAVYGGDLLGNLWRFDITATSGAYPMMPDKLAVLTNAADDVQPVTSRPSMELHPKTKKRMVLVGTGRLLDSSDINSTQEQSFYAIEDGNQVRFNREGQIPEQLPAGVSFPITRAKFALNSDLLAGYTATEASPMGWYVDLGKGASNVAWRVVSDSKNFFGTVAFAPTLPNISDPCQPSGSSLIYAADYASGISRVTNADGSAAAFVTGGTGVVTDLGFFSVGGKVRLVGGTDSGEVKRVPGEFGTAIGLKRLNWRELPVVN